VYRSSLRHHLCGAHGSKRGFRGLSCTARCVQKPGSVLLPFIYADPVAGEMSIEFVFVAVQFVTSHEVSDRKSKPC
jgi:hypothetical protein